MTEIKAELKLAREAIKKKEYKEALKHCKNVMKVDKQSYNALVFIGVCATELEQFEQAKQAYKKAIEQNKDQILAWQGVCSLYEKAKNKAWNGELIETYIKLLKDHISENDKWIEMYNKLISLLKQENRIAECLVWLKESIPKYSNSESAVFAWKEIISLLSTHTLSDRSKPEEVLELLHAFRSVIKLADSISFDVENECVQYLEFVIGNAKSSSFEFPSLHDACELAKKFHERYENNCSILEMFCKILLCETVGQEVIPEKTLKCFEKLSSLQQDSDVNYINGFIEYAKRKFSSAASLLNQVLATNKKDPVSIYYLAKCYSILHQHKTAQHHIVACRSAISNALFNATVRSLEQQLDILEIELQLEKEFSESNQRNVEILVEKLSQQADISSKVQILKVKADIKFGALEKAIESITIIDEDTAHCKHELLQVKATISMEEKKYYDAELRLQEALELVDDYKSHFLLGNVYWMLGSINAEYFPKAYSEYLKAAKLDSQYSPTFVVLGQYQKDFIKDQNKALKCYEKAFSLDVSNKDAGSSLGDLYLHLNMEEKALQLYEAVTSQAQIGESVWAWVRLGLIHLKQQNADRAIFCFQHALRGKADVSHYWECLAEAYFSKGSYTSALRAFSKAVQLDPSSTFCKYKIAKVKQMLSLDVEAVIDYKELLEMKPDYIPALLGLSETHLHQEKEKLKMTFDGRAIEHAQQVMNYIARAISIQPTFTCLWKTLGDSLTALHAVNTDKCRVSVPKNIQKLLAVEVEEKASKSEVMELATRCFMTAVKLREDTSTLWHDLAVSTFHWGMVLEGQQGKEKLLQSVEIVKKALTLDSSNHMFWNTLGVITGLADIQDPRLSQHAFIKALELNAQDGQVWANLGILYLKHNKVQAAHEALKKAQACDPTLVQAWIGQAIIAETIADDDAMDLFRHATELNFHGEGSLAYAQWVCQLLQSIKEKSILRSTQPKPDMSHLPHRLRRIVLNASVALQKSTERFKHDPCSYNTLGVLLEQEGLFKQAEQAFSCARHLLSSQPVDDHQTKLLRHVLLNQARILCELKKFDDAIEIYNIVSLETASEICYIALAYYASGQLKKSYEAYEKALRVASSGGEKSCILAAMGMVSYASQDADSAKSLLFKSSQLDDCSEHGLMALSALGLLHGDGTLATAALVETSKHKLCNTESFELKRTMLISSFYLLQGQTKAAERSIMKAIVRFPDNSELWCKLSKFLMQNSPNDFKSVVLCTKIAQHHGPSEIASKTAAITSLAFPVDNRQNVLKSVQRLLHSHPENAESWVLLASALMTQSVLKKKATDSLLLTKMTKLALAKVDESLNSLKNFPSKLPQQDRKMFALYTDLYSWMMKSFVISNIYYGDIAVAETFCNHIIPSLHGDKAQEDFIFLKGLAISQNGDNQSGLENIRVMSKLALQSPSTWKWKIMSQLHHVFGVPASAELCQRHLIKYNIQHNSSNFATLLIMCLLAVKTFESSKDTYWLDRGQEVIAELMRSSDSDHVVILLRAIIFSYQGNKKAALKYLQKLTFVENPLIADLQEKFLALWK